MPFRTFNQWLFDRNKDTPIPPPNGKIDILKYNSPITHTWVLQLFMRHGPLNQYLDEYFNNIGLRYIPKDEFFRFIKKCVMDFKVTKTQTVFYKWRRQDKLYNILRDKFPQFKNDDITLLSELIERSDDKKAIYESLGMELPKKKKIKTGKKTTKKGKTSVKDFLAGSFSIMEETPRKS
ncbi:MAG: hypothetical protein K9L62_10965 [Vallitaleaceae bacterium]|nr:hypothetical protein [Vallitaleaceae bacterium]